MTRRGNKSRSPPGRSDGDVDPLVDRLVHQLQLAQARIAELEELLGSSAAPPRAIGDHDSIGLAALTPRQREIARLYTIHANDKRIAARLGIAVQTVRNHLAAIQRKLRVVSREELVLRLCSRTGSQGE